MAIFHYTIKIVGRSKGKSVISASAYSSIKERLEASRQSIAEREREAAKRKRHDRGMSR